MHACMHTSIASGQGTAQGSPRTLVLVRTRRCGRHRPPGLLVRMHAPLLTVTVDVGAASAVAGAAGGDVGAAPRRCWCPRMYSSLCCSTVSAVASSCPLARKMWGTAKLLLPCRPITCTLNVDRSKASSTGRHRGCAEAAAPACCTAAAGHQRSKAMEHSLTTAAVAFSSPCSNPRHTLVTRGWTSLPMALPSRSSTPCSPGAVSV